jgi:hypothetical protein
MNKTEFVLGDLPESNFDMNCASLFWRTFPKVEEITFEGARTSASTINALTGE